VVKCGSVRRRMLSRDARAAPRAGWRVAWAVAGGAPASALCRLARSPRELARLRPALHVHYYAARALLPPLHRCLSLLGADVFKWLHFTFYNPN
jgi:DNA polymerase zeta